jgi:hypothetical protein
MRPLQPGGRLQEHLFNVRPGARSALIVGIDGLVPLFSGGELGTGSRVDAGKNKDRTVDHRQELGDGRSRSGVMWKAAAVRPTGAGSRWRTTSGPTSW